MIFVYTISNFLVQIISVAKKWNFVATQTIDHILI